MQSRLLALLSIAFLLFSIQSFSQTPCAGVSGAIGVSGFNNTDGDFYQFCVGSDVSLELLNASLPDGASAYSYDWQFTSQLVESTLSPLLLISDLPAGVYGLELVIGQPGICATSIPVDLPISIAAFPTISILDSLSVCEGSVGELVGQFNQPTANMIVPISVENQVQLVDASLTTIPLIVDGVLPGSTITSCDQLANVFVNMEHSYMADLTIQVTCPNGQSAVLHQGGGGGAFIGAPVDNTAGTPGVGFDYVWDQNSTNGTWAANANGTLPAGTYTPVGNLCNLVGCPVAGTWTLTSQDNAGADDGFLFEFGISISSEFFNQQFDYTPSIGMGADSTFWYGEGIVLSDPNADVINVSGEVVGTSEVTYSVTNSAGCTSEAATVVTVSEIPEGLNVDAGYDFNYSNINNQLNGNVFVENDCNATIEFTYCLRNNSDITYTYCPETYFNCSAPISVFFESGALENGFDYVRIHDGPSITDPVLGQFDGTLTGLNFISSHASGCITLFFHTDVSISCSNGNQPPVVVQLSANSVGIANYYWTPSDQLSNATILNPTITSTTQETFVLHGYMQNFESCILTDTVVVQMPQNYISGRVFQDLNSNGIFNVGDALLPYYPVTVNGYTAMSDVNGDYVLPGNEGNNVVSIEVDNTIWNATTPTVLNVSIAGNNNAAGNDFGLIAAEPNLLVTGSVSGYSPLCDAVTEFVVTITNNGNSVASGTLLVSIDELLVITGISPFPISFLNNQATFSYSNLEVGLSTDFVFTLVNPGSNAAGSLITNTLSVFVDQNGESILTDQSVVSQLLSCSSAVQSKTELAGIGEDHVITQDGELVYLIQFTNPYLNASSNIIVTDVLDANLDPLSISLLGSSHPVSYNILPGGVVQFVFENINLASFASGGDGGFVEFSVGLLPNVAMGTVINNTAQIQHVGLGVQNTNTTSNLVGGCSAFGLEIIQDPTNPSMYHTNLDGIIVDWYLNGILIAQNTPSVEVSGEGALQAFGYSAGGCVWESGIWSITQIVEASDLIQFNLWPNPSEGIVRWQTNINVESLEIFDQVGRLLVKTGVANITVYDMSNFANGSYHLVFETSSGTFVHRQLQVIH